MLERYLSLKLAANMLIGALGLLLIFHILVLLGVLGPAREASVELQSQILITRAGAAVVNALMMLMIAIRIDYIQLPKLKPFAKTAMWVIFVFLVLNLATHLSSTNTTEKAIFIPVTLILAICAYRLAMREKAVE